MDYENIESLFRERHRNLSCLLAKGQSFVEEFEASLKWNNFISDLAYNAGVCEFSYFSFKFCVRAEIRVADSPFGQISAYVKDDLYMDKPQKVFSVEFKLDDDLSDSGGESSKAFFFDVMQGFEEFLDKNRYMVGGYVEGSHKWPETD